MYPNKKDTAKPKVETVTVKMETRWLIECPNGCEEQDVNPYEIGTFECTHCGYKAEYNSEPDNCEVV